MAKLLDRDASPASSDRHEQAALGELLGALRARAYHFVTITPASHARVVARPGRDRAQSLTDVFGWSLRFERSAIDAEIVELLDAAGALERDGLLWRSAVRVSSLGGELYLHSAYPTDQPDAVFFGPDSYRFVRFIEAELAPLQPAPQACIVDIGTGAGVGAIAAAKRLGAQAAIGTDVNPKALGFAVINARAAGVALQPILGTELDGVERGIDVALANPPYIADDDAREYSDGGGMLGGEVALEMTRSAVERLAPGGRLLLYTGSAIVRGEDRLRSELARLVESSGCSLRYAELDPDVFGEELERAAYRDVDRIAVVGAVMKAPE